jgi:hypothetical protein
MTLITILGPRVPRRSEAWRRDTKLLRAKKKGMNRAEFLRKAYSDSDSWDLRTVYDKEELLVIIDVLRAAVPRPAKVLLNRNHRAMEFRDTICDMYDDIGTDCFQFQ